MYEAQQNISRIALEEARLNQIKRDKEKNKKKEANEATPAPAQPSATPPKPDPKAEEWASQNDMVWSRSNNDICRLWYT